MHIAYQAYSNIRKDNWMCSGKRGLDISFKTFAIYRLSRLFLKSLSNNELPDLFGSNLIVRMSTIYIPQPTVRLSNLDY